MGLFLNLRHLHVAKEFPRKICICCNTALRVSKATALSKNGEGEPQLPNKRLRESLIPTVRNGTGLSTRHKVKPFPSLNHNDPPTLV